MPIPGSGTLRVSCINAELGRTATTANSYFAGSSIPLPYSLFGLGNQFGVLNQSAPHSMSEWYGYNSVVTSCLLLYVNAAVPQSYAGSGTTWSDLSVNANNATLINGPTYSSVCGGAITFDGVNDYGTFSNSIKGANTDSFTLSAFARVASFNPSKGYVTIARGFDQSGAYYEGWSMFLAFTGCGKAQLGITTTSPSIASYTVTGSTTATANNWYQLTGVWTAGSSLAVFMNGAFQACVSNTTTNLRNSTNGFVLGSVGVSAFYDTTIANAMAYNRALSGTEILQNYNALKGRFGL